MRLFIQASAAEDILHQAEHYAEQGLPDIARRFAAAVRSAVEALIIMPSAGVPVLSGNPALAGLRTWPVSHFDAFRVYYLAQPDLIAVIRVLHGKRDTRTILEDQTVENPR